MKKGFLVAAFLVSVSFVLTGCYSVFSGGTGGQIVDSESTSTPKAGIANVDVYAYVKSGDRNSDYNKWQEGTVFVPHAEYYGHTTTGANGNFTISKLVWKSGKPDFGKDADYTEIFLLFYHENYGLTKGSTIIVSDSTADTVYAELTKIRKETVINLNLKDVSTDPAVNVPVYVKVCVPQTTEKNTEAAPKLYDAIIIGSGTINVSYPRWQSDEDKQLKKETEPEVIIEYVQSSDEITWAGCYNMDNDEKNYAFRGDDEGVTVINKKIKNPSYTINLYGKKTKLSMPVFSGVYGTVNGVEIALKAKSDSIDCGVQTTKRRATADTIQDGYFSNLGSGFYWDDKTYTGKFATVDVSFYSGDTKLTSTINQVRSDVSAYEVKLN